MAKHAGLHLRGSRWYARINVPKDLWGVMGKREVWRSLRTGNRRVALTRLKGVQHETTLAFDRARRRRREGVSDAELRSLVRTWFADLDRRRAKQDAETFGEDLARAMENLEEDVGMLLAGADAEVMPAVQATADGLLARVGVKLDKGSEQYHAFVSGMRRAMVEGARRSRRRLRDEQVEPVDAEFAGAGAGQMSVADLVDDFMAEPRQLAVSQKTRDQRRSAFAILKKALGAETSVASITRRDARAVRDALLARRRARPATVNAKLSLYAALFKHAVREHGLPTNVFEGLSVPDPVRAKDKRRAFGRDELKAVVAQPPDGESMRWVLALGLYNGLRLSEAVGLRRKDVRREGGVVVIDIVPHGDRGLKTEASRRTVPAHPAIADSLLDYMRGEPWADLPAATRAKVAGQRVQRYLRRTVSEDAKLVPHSARHTFRDRMREGEVSRDAAMQLGGWTGGSVADSYGSGMSPKALLKELRKVKYDVDLAPLIGNPAPRKRRRKGS